MNLLVELRLPYNIVYLLTIRLLIIRMKYLTFLHSYDDESIVLFKNVIDKYV